jgi:hypothetical protein
VIYNYRGTLSLESCIFSGNRATDSNRCGGAIYNRGTLNVSGCTFYGNTSDLYGGAIYNDSGTLTLTGNLFYGNNTTRNSHNVVYGNTVNSGGYNVSDMASGTDNSTGSGWDFAAGDIQSADLPITPVSFKPLPGSAAIGAVTAKPAVYPEYDFYGTAIPAVNAAAGAVQGIAAAGYYLDYSALNGTVSVAAGSAAPDGDGICSPGSSVSLEAVPDSGYTFYYWTVNGVRQGTQSPANKITLTMDGHRTVRAVCVRSVIVNSAADSGAGSLREALSNAEDYDLITLDPSLTGQTIALTSRLPAITKIITIEGNGVTLSGSGIPAGSSSQIMAITGGEVILRRLHFKDGRAADNGGAIHKTGGTANLESCIFSGNRTTASLAYGGAIYNQGALTVSGCTFSGNTTNYRGGGIYNDSGTISLTGNLFYGNTAPGSNVVHNNNGTVSSGGYNISDRASGTDHSAGSGWTFAATDRQITDISFDTDFKPSSASGLNIITPSLPEGFPAIYFDGTSRTIPARPGAL